MTLLIYWGLLHLHGAGLGWYILGVAVWVGHLIYHWD
jgi:hypothetical protein